MTTKYNNKQRAGAIPCPQHKERTMSEAEKAFEIQEKISKLIDKLKDLGFEFMYYNSISSIRKLRK
tara:strand:- start:1626 stop:1823 length:198 start_codon:yes stop_codon:yes gene_type:complete